MTKNQNERDTYKDRDKEECLNADENHMKNANLIFSKRPNVLKKLSLVVECNKNYKNDDWTDRQLDIKRAPLQESRDFKRRTDSKM